MAIEIPIPDAAFENVPPSIDEDIETIRRTHDFDLGDAPYQPEVLAVARAAERLADEVERLRALVRQGTAPDDAKEHMR